MKEPVDRVLRWVIESSDAFQPIDPAYSPARERKTMNWAMESLASPTFHPSMVLAALLLGLLSMAGAFCNVSLLLACGGFIGSRKTSPILQGWTVTAAFLLASVTIFVVAGWGLEQGRPLVSETVGAIFHAAAGLTAILFGLFSMGLTPGGPLSGIRFTGGKPGLMAGAAFFGFMIGLANISCMSHCSASLLAAVEPLSTGLKHPLLATFLYGLLGTGYTLPLISLFLVLHLLGRSGFAATYSRQIQTVSGFFILASGFWILATP